MIRLLLGDKFVKFAIFFIPSICSFIPFCFRHVGKGNFDTFLENNTFVIQLIISKRQQVLPVLN